MTINARLHAASFRVFPGICVVCGLPSGIARDLCPDCEQALPRPGSACQICADRLPFPAVCGACLNRPPAFSRVITPLLFTAPVDRLIHAFKYRGDLTAGIVLTDVLARHLAADLADRRAPELLLPVPLHWSRLLWRGYNQAGEIARQLSSRLKIPVAADRIRRCRQTPPSQGLDRSQRLANLRQAFTLRGRDINGLHLALVDDVVTSTATARTLAQVLRQGGAREVEVWCLARTALAN